MLSPELRQKIEIWTRPPFDAATIAETKRLLAAADASGDDAELRDRFQLDLKFGTGGLRGVVGVGTSRMNRENVAKATQGVADYLKTRGDIGKPTAVVGYDSRTHSLEFAKTTAAAFAANGIKCFIFAALRPTPMLSHATMELGTTVGVMVTASHNPPEYNGYKLYWGNGCQVSGQQADDIIDGVSRVQYERLPAADFDALLAKGLIEWIGPEFDDHYLATIKKASLAPDICAKHGGAIKIAFTGLHGTGGTVGPRALADWGFSRVAIVKEQDAPDGNFPTVKSPNPEERAALDMALALADREGSDLVLGTDPDADRVGIAVRDDAGKLVLCNGNDVGALLAYYQIERRRELGALPSNAAVIKTVVTTDLINAICRDNNVEVFDCLTGFKYIGELMNDWDDEGREASNPKKTFLLGAEESYGCLVGTHTRDKDAIVACCAIAEVAAWARERGSTLYDLLKRIHATHGVYREGLMSKTLKGLKGMEQIASIIDRLRNDPPRTMLGEKLTKSWDVGESVVRDGDNKVVGQLPYPKENFVQLFYGDALKVTGRPSGTEPKIKFYVAAAQREGLPLPEAEVPAIRQKLDWRIKEVEKAIDALVAEVIGG